MKRLYFSCTIWLVRNITLTFHRAKLTALRGDVRALVHCRTRSALALLSAGLLLVTTLVEVPGSRASSKGHSRAAKIRPASLADNIILEIPTPAPNSGPYGIAAGADGNLWITEQKTNKIARMTPDGSSFTEFPIPTAASRPFGITAGPDGNVWFAEADANKIGRVTVSSGAAGSVAPEAVGTITEFPLPFPGSAPFLLTAGPDGNVWFTLFSASNIGKITPSGSVTQYEIPTHNCGPSGITTGPDGNIWFTEYFSNKIGMVTTSGVFAEFSIPTPNSAPFDITAGASNDLWFTEQLGNKIGQIKLTAQITAEAADFVPESISVKEFLAHGGPTGVVFQDLDDTENDDRGGREDPEDEGSRDNVLVVDADGNAIEKGEGSDNENLANEVRPADIPSFSQLPIPTPAAGAAIIKAAPDGTVWFTENTASKIGKIVPIISLSPAAQSVVRGNSASFSIGIQPGGFVGPASLTAAVAPADATITTSFSTNVVNPGGMATLTVNTTGATTLGDYSITVTGAAGGVTHSSSILLTITGSDFSLGFDQSTVTAQAGTKARVTVNINRIGGFTGNVTVTPPDPAGGIKPKPADPITTTDTTATFKLKIGGGAASGPHQLVFKGKDDSGRERAVTLTLVVQ